RFERLSVNEYLIMMRLVKYIQSNLYLDFIWIDSLRDSLLIRKEYFSNNSLLINMETINLLKESNGALVTKYYKPIDLSHFKYLEKKFNVNSFYTFSLEKLLHLCANKQISVFLFVPPIANSLLNKNSSRFFQTLTSYLDKLQKRYPKHFINFSLSPYPSSKMIGGNHTNRIGGVEFSKKVYKYIQFMEEKNSKMINK
ncbi:MAG: hypothetical protein KDD35_01380, partial [Bdellovibrionales bacterium]|nr:hypothetical protein [Bdellovibrionales bacterium]